jgi:hypothetical protein
MLQLVRHGQEFAVIPGSLCDPSRWLTVSPPSPLALDCRCMFTSLPEFATTWWSACLQPRLP